MGYYVTLEHSTAFLPIENYDEAYRLMCELNKHDELKRGGSWSSDGKTKSWFSWMDENYPETCKDAKAIIAALGFECRPEEGGLEIWGYDNKMGQEDLFFDAISHLLHGEMEWRGEDGSMWKWVFGGPLEVLDGRVVYG